MIGSKCWTLLLTIHYGHGRRARLELSAPKKCSGIRVDHCRECRGDFHCNVCYRVADEAKNFSTGIVCAERLISSECQASGSFLTGKSVICRIDNTHLVQRPTPPKQPRRSAVRKKQELISSHPKTCPSHLLDIVVAKQELPSVPDNSFNLCSAHKIRPDVGVLNIKPAIKSIPIVMKMAVEWLMFAGGYERNSNGTAEIGNSDLMVDVRLRERMRYLPSSDSPWIAYTMRGVSMPKKLIVYCHGNFEAVHQIHYRMFDELARSLHATVVGFEYPGYGGSEWTKGQSTITSVKYVTMAGLNWARQMWGWDTKDILVIGRSIGTGPAAEAAAAYEQIGSPLAGLILISPYESIKKLVTEKVHGISLLGAFATQSYYFQTDKNIGAMTKTPVLIAHGIEDQVISVSHSDEIYKKACEECKTSGRVKYLRLEYFGHNDLEISDIMEHGGHEWLAANPAVTEGHLQHEAFTSEPCIMNARSMCPYAASREVHEASTDQDWYGMMW